MRALKLDLREIKRLGRFLLLLEAKLRSNFMQEGPLGCIGAGILVKESYPYMLIDELYVFLYVHELGMPWSIRILGGIHVFGFLPRNRPMMFIGRQAFHCKNACFLIFFQKSLSDVRGLSGDVRDACWFSAFCGFCCICGLF